MTPEQKPEKHLIDDYIKLHRYGLCLPGETVTKPPVLKTGDAVKDYLAAAGYGLPKKTEV